jgi:YcaO cyclodehydratase, ATP-ad Mg2+-binding
MSTNGLASGNCFLEAVRRGLCEVIERDATSLWRQRSAHEQDGGRLSLGTIDDPKSLAILDLWANAELDVAVWDITTDVRAATFQCFVVDRTPSATHDQRAGALSRQSPARTLRRGPSQGRPAGMSADRFPPAPAYVNSVSVRLATREGRANAVRDALMSAPRPSATATPRPEGP